MIERGPVLTLKEELENLKYKSALAAQSGSLEQIFTVNRAFDELWLAEGKNLSADEKAEMKSAIDALEAATLARFGVPFQETADQINERIEGGLDYQSAIALTLEQHKRTSSQTVGLGKDEMERFRWEKFRLRRSEKVSDFLELRHLIYKTLANRAVEMTPEETEELNKMLQDLAETTKERFGMDLEQLGNLVEAKVATGMDEYIAIDEVIGGSPPHGQTKQKTETKVSKEEESRIKKAEENFAIVEKLGEIAGETDNEFIANQASELYALIEGGASPIMIRKFVHGMTAMTEDSPLRKLLMPLAERAVAATGLSDKEFIEAYSIADVESMSQAALDYEIGKIESLRAQRSLSKKESLVLGRMIARRQKLLKDLEMEEEGEIQNRKTFLGNNKDVLHRSPNPRKVENVDIHATFEEAAAVHSKDVLQNIIRGAEGKETFVAKPRTKEPRILEVKRGPEPKPKDEFEKALEGIENADIYQLISIAAKANLVEADHNTDPDIIARATSMYSAIAKQAEKIGLPSGSFGVIFNNVKERFKTNTNFRALVGEELARERKVWQEEARKLSELKNPNPVQVARLMELLSFGIRPEEEKVQEQSPKPLQIEEELSAALASKDPLTAEGVWALLEQTKLHFEEDSKTPAKTQERLGELNEKLANKLKEQNSAEYAKLETLLGKPKTPEEEFLEKDKAIGDELTAIETEFNTNRESLSSGQLEEMYQKLKALQNRAQDIASNHRPIIARLRGTVRRKQIEVKEEETKHIREISAVIGETEARLSGGDKLKKKELQRLYDRLIQTYGDHLWKISEPGGENERTRRAYDALRLKLGSMLEQDLELTDHLVEKPVDKWLDKEYLKKWGELEPATEAELLKFRKASAKFAKIPYEWGLPRAKQEQREAYDAMDKEYLAARQKLEKLLKTEPNAKELAHQLIQENGRVMMKQWEIEDPVKSKAWTKAILSAVAASKMGAYFRLGTYWLSGKERDVADLGMFAGSFLAMGLGERVGSSLAIDKLDKEERLARRGKADSEAGIPMLAAGVVANRLDYRVAQLDESIINKRTEKLLREMAIERIRKTRTWLSAEAIDADDKRVKEMMETMRADKWDLLYSSAERAELENLITNVHYVEMKLAAGHINFGKKRAGETYELYKSLTKAKKALYDHDIRDVPSKKISAKIERSLEKREGAINKRQNAYITKRAHVGAAVATLVSLGGAFIASLIEK